MNDQQMDNQFGVTNGIQTIATLRSGGLLGAIAGVPPSTTAYIPKKSKKPWIILGVVVVLIALGIVGSRVGWFSKQEQYHAVFLNSGSIYIGKLNTSSYKLTNAYLVQVNASGTPSLVPSSQIVGSDNDVYLRKEEVSYYEKLPPTNPAVKSITGAK